jgi:hypothetical protein
MNMLKKFLFALALLCSLTVNVQHNPVTHTTHVTVGAPAQATELNSDVGFDNASAWMKDPSGTNLWTVSGSKANGNGATSMQMLMGMSNGVLKGHTFLVTGDVAGRTTGTLEIGLGLTMTGTSTFVPRTAPVTPIADPFTTSLGTTTTSFGAHDDVRAAFRMICSAGPHATIDPVVYPGQEGRSHLHRFFGYTGVTANTDYAEQRSTRGMTTCGSIDPLHPLNKSLYWHPDMLDGLGNSIQPNIYNLYYKQWSQNNPECSTPGSTNYMPGVGGACVNIPTALREIIGYNSATGVGGPSGGTPIMHWECWDYSSGSLVIHGPYAHLKDFFGSGAAPCPYSTDPTKNSMVGMFFVFPTCWDGVNVDTADHRSHLAWPSVPKPIGYSACAAPYPYVIPSIELQIYWEADPQLVAGKWCLSSDQMVDGVCNPASGNFDPGKTFHSDYMMGWSPPTIQKMFDRCFGDWLTCAGGALGDGTGIKGGDQTATSNQLGGGPDGHPINDLRYEPTANAGLSAPITANGSFAVEVKAAANGHFELIGIDGFNGTVDNLSVTEIPNGRKGPITITSTGGMAMNDNMPTPANDNQLAEVLPINFDLHSVGN